MPHTDVAPLEASIQIDAPPARVWSLVSDLTHMRRWSPQNRFTVVFGGVTRNGAKFISLNRRGLLVWPTQGMVVEYEAPRRIAFRIKENWTIWSYTLEPTQTGGTRLVARREAPQGISDLSVALTSRVLGGVDSFTAELRAGLEETLAKIKADAERP